MADKKSAETGETPLLEEARLTPTKGKRTVVAVDDEGDDESAEPPEAVELHDMTGEIVLYTFDGHYDGEGSPREIVRPAIVMSGEKVTERRLVTPASKKKKTRAVYEDLEREILSLHVFLTDEDRANGLQEKQPHVLHESEFEGDSARGIDAEGPAFGHWRERGAKS